MYTIKNIKTKEIFEFESEKELNKFCHDNKLDKSTLKRTDKIMYKNNNRYRNHHKNFMILNNYDLKEEIYKKYEIKNNIITAEQIIELKNPNGLTEEDILNFFKLSVKEWKVTDYHITMYQASNKDSLKGKTDLYSVRTKFKKITEGEKIDYEKIKESIFEALTELPQASTPIELPESLDNTTLVVNIPDLHLNKYAMVDGTGVIYDTNIATQRYINSLNYILNEDTSNKCILVVGEDFFNIDNLDKSTTKGTPQTTNLTYYQMYRQGYKILTQVLTEMSKKYREIEVILVQGNHDTVSTFTLVIALEAYFKEFNNIIWDTTAVPRKYRKIGNNTAFGFGHLNNETKQTKHLLMPIEAPELYGSTKYRYTIQGHLHNLSVKEEGGIQHWTLPTISSEGEWEISKGYVGSVKSAIGFVVTENKGISKILIYNE